MRAAKIDASSREGAGLPFHMRGKTILKKAIPCDLCDFRVTFGAILVCPSLRLSNSSPERPLATSPILGYMDRHESKTEMVAHGYPAWFDL